MRRLLVIILVIAGIFVAAALAAPALIPTEFLRDRLETETSQRLGREVAIAGDIRLTILPKLQARADDVRIANAPGFADAPFAEMSQMRFTLALGPLLSREAVVEEFVLVEPVIRLEQRGGRNNWTFASPDAPQPVSSEGFARRSGALPFDASFGDVRIENGAVSYTADGASRQLSDVDLAFSLPSLDAPFTVRGSLIADGEAMELDAEAGSLRGVFEGARTPLTLDIDSEMADIAFDGALLESERFDFDGQTDISLGLRRLAAFFGTELPAGEGFRRFDAEAAVSGRPGRVSLSDADIRFDDITATGALDIDYARIRPYVTGRLDIPELDLNTYLPAEQARPGGIGPWSEEPVDLSPLSAVDAELTATAGRLIARDIEVTDVALAATLDQGRLNVDLSEFLLYGGRGSATAVANTRSATPSYSLDAELNALNALPFLQAAADFERLEGLGSISLDLLASGRSPSAIMDSLSGQGAFNFENGAIVGVNLAQVIRSIQTAVETGELPSGFGERQQTDFTALAGTISIQNGVARNPDLTMLSPLLRVLGSGEVDLGDQRIDYRLNPRAVQSLTGQGGETDLQGLQVPIRIRGGFNDVSIGVDFEAVARDLVRARAGRLIGGEAGAALGEGRSIEDVAAGALLEALTRRGEDDGEAPAEGEEEETERSDPGRALLEGLLSRTRGGDEEEEAPPPDDDGGGE